MNDAKSAIGNTVVGMAGGKLLEKLPIKSILPKVHANAHAAVVAVRKSGVPVNRELRKIIESNAKESAKTINEATKKTVAGGAVESEKRGQ